MSISVSHFLMLFFPLSWWGYYIPCLPPPRACFVPLSRANFTAKHRDSRKFRLPVRCWLAAPPGRRRRECAGARSAQPPRLPRPSWGSLSWPTAAAAGVGSLFVQQVPSPRGLRLAESDGQGVKVALPAETDLGLPGHPGRAWSG